MNELTIAAGMMAVIDLVAGWQRPRLAVIVSGILVAALRRLGASGGDRRPVRCELHFSRRSFVFLFPYWGLQPTAPTSRTIGHDAHMKSGIAPANFAITDWESFQTVSALWSLPGDLQCPQSANSRHEEVYIAAPH